MTNPTPEHLAKLAEGLTAAQRESCIFLCGNAWRGISPSPAMWEMNALGLMHIDGIKSLSGSWVSFKSHPTPIGLALHHHLKGTTHAE